jgi:protein SCO1/2
MSTALKAASFARFGVILAAILILRGPEPATLRAEETRSAPPPGTILENVGFDQNLGRQLPLDLPLVDETGAGVKLGDYFGARPVILNLVYFRCPMLCGQTLVSLTRSLRALTISPGAEFDVITVSFDPTETPKLAAAKKQATLQYLGRARADRGWHFLTGEEEAIRCLTQAVGFQYTYNPVKKQYAHAAGIVILSPDGLITRYYLGLDYPSKELKASLEAAAGRKVASPVARLLLLCYDYDPASGKYTLAIVRILQVLGVATALALCAYVVTQLVLEHRRGHASRMARAPGAALPVGSGGET